MGSMITMFKVTMLKDQALLFLRQTPRLTHVPSYNEWEDTNIPTQAHNKNSKLKRNTP